MEFPDLGRNCSNKTCNKLDFLPMKCDACHDVFCSEHFAYTNHNCEAAVTRNVQVPACPLCGVPVPGRRGEPLDLAMGAHIDNYCTSDPATRRREKIQIFKNRCSVKGCKGRELMPLVCQECTLNFCLRHRHAVDHACEGKLAAKRKRAAEAAMTRMATENRPNDARSVLNKFSVVQGNMTEDEALANALALSLQDAMDAETEEQSLRARDTGFARALNRQRVGGDQNQRCTVS